MGALPRLAALVRRLQLGVNWEGKNERGKNLKLFWSCKDIICMFHPKVHHATGNLFMYFSMFGKLGKGGRESCPNRKAKNKISGPCYGQGHEKMVHKTATIQAASMPDLSLKPFSLQRSCWKRARKHTWEFLEALRIICWLPTIKKTKTSYTFSSELYFLTLSFF